MRVTKKQIEKRVSGIYARHCEGIEIPITSMRAIMALGTELVSAGADDETIGAALRAAAEKAAKGPHCGVTIVYV